MIRPQMAVVTVLVLSNFILGSAFAGSTASGKHAPHRKVASSDRDFELARQFCAANPSQCMEVENPTISFSGDKKYRIEAESNVGGTLGLLQAICIDRGMKAVAAYSTAKAAGDRSEFLFVPGENYVGQADDTLGSGAFARSVFGSISSRYVSKVVCSPQ